MSDDFDEELDVHVMKVLYEAYRSAGPIRQIGAIEALIGTRFGVLHEEGFAPEEVGRVVSAGVRTVDGVRAVLTGTPTEWVLAFESGEALGFGTEVAT